MSAHGASTPQSAPGWPRRQPWIILALAFFVVGLPFLAWYPMPSGDEIIGNDPAAEWVLHGRVQSSVFAELPGFERGYFLQPPGQMLSAAAIYAVGGVSIFTTRLNALVWGAAALAAWGTLAHAWSGSRRTGFLTALLIGCIPVFGHSVAAARMDAQALCLLALALRLWLPGTDGTPAKHPVAAGVLLGLAGLTHPVAIFWAIGMAAGAMFREQPRRRQVLWLTAGAVVPFGLWLGWASFYRAEFVRQFMGHGTGKLGGLDLAALVAGEANRVVTSFAQQPLLPLLYVCGAIHCWTRFKSTPRFRIELAWLAASVVLGTTLLLEKESGPHLLYYAALLSFGAGVWLDAMLQRTSSVSGWRPFAAAAAMAAVAAIGVVRWTVPRLVAVTVQREARDHDAFARELSRLVPPRSVVTGEPVSWYAIRATGGWLRLAVAPDPTRHHFVISPAAKPWRPGPPFEFVGEVGRPLPAWLGRTFSHGEQLHVQVLRNRTLSPPLTTP